MRALITGGAGFIGSHLSELLLNQGHAVTIIDDLSTGSRDNVRHLEDRKDFEMVVDTVANEQIVKRLAAPVDVIYHLAGHEVVQPRRKHDANAYLVDVHARPTGG